MPTPEELARQNIDKQLTACGWIVQDSGEAMREFPLEAVLVRAASEARLRQSVLKSAFEGRL